jgi:predicted acetyltransferase
MPITRARASRSPAVDNGSMPIEVRTAKKSERELFFTTLNAAFSGEPPVAEDDSRFGDILEQKRMIIALDNKDCVGATATFSFNLQIPGAEVPAGGVTMVGVLPTHRRRGILRSMMSAQFEDSKKQKEPIAILWASEGAIYTNFGYGLAIRHATMDLEREHTTLRTPPASDVRSMLLDHEEALKVLPDVYERARSDTPGMFERSLEWWKDHRFYDPEHRREGAGPLRFVLIEIAGSPVAYALYNVHQKWGSDGISASTLEVWEDVATEPVAHIELWRYIFGVDLVARFQADWLSVDHPLTWALREPRRMRMRVQDGLWLRLIDLADALSRRAYATDGTMILEVTDPLLEENSGVWSVSAKSGTATVKRTKKTPDLSLGIEDLGATFLGGATFTELSRAGRVIERTPGAIFRADTMWRWSPLPWCPEIF